MARILRRRVVQMPKVASGRRNLASEINQWLKLGLNAGQIIEKIIPDDPSITPEMMDPVFDMMARRQGATAPLAERVARARQLAGIQEKQPSSEVPKPPSQGLGAPPAPSPGAAAPQQYLRPPPMDASVAGVPMAKVVSPEDMESTPTRANRESLIAQAVQSGDTQEQAAEWADSMLRSEAEALATRDAATEAERAQAKSQAKAKVSQSIQEAQIAENAAQLKSSFRQMYNAIKEGSGMYDFADNVQRAVPLFFRAAQASKASGDDVRLLQTIIRKSVREAELADKQAGRMFKQKQFDAKVKETKRREKVEADAEKLEWENKNDFQDKKTKDALRVAQEKGKQTRLNKKTRATPATSQEQMLGKGTALDANKKIAAAQADKEKSKKNLEAGLKDPRIAKLVELNDKGGLTELKKLTDAEVKRLLPIYRLIGEIEASDEIIKIQTAREKAAREQMANRAGIDRVDQGQTGANKSTRTRTPEEIKALGAEAAGVFPSE